ncbi:MAG: glycosyltransferase [Planctomycetota bacterium]|nr:MAG: glycosyltransferase [Planctomycetota bacterium]
MCWPQGEGDLGRRLRNGSDRAWAEGAAGVILLGADSPTLPPSFLDATLRRLNRYDAIFGPCEDGGYYLLASRRPCEALFDHIDWGGSEVADQTRRRAKEAKLKLHELPYWYDLDRFDDLRLAKRDLLRYEMTKLPEFAALHETIERLLEGSKA